MLKIVYKDKKMSKFYRILFLVLMLGNFVAADVFAGAEGTIKAQKYTTTKPVQDSVDGNDETAQNENYTLKRISTRLREIEDQIVSDDFTKKSIEEDLIFLNEAELALEGEIRKLEKEQAYAQEALAAFGEVNSENADDESSAAINEMKERYLNSVSVNKNKLIEANLLKTEVMRLDEAIHDARNRIVIGILVAEKNALIVPRTFFKAISDAAVFFFNVTVSPIVWYQNLSDEELEEFYHNVWYVLLILGLAWGVGLYLRSYIIHHWGYRRTEDIPGYGQKVIVAIVTALAYGIIPSLIIGGCFIWEYNNADLYETQFGKVIASILFYAFFMILSRAATRVVLAPWNGKWRLFNISDARAERVYRAMTFSIILSGVAACCIHIASYFKTTDEMMLLFAVGLDAIKALTIILVTVSVFGEIKNKADDEQTEEVAVAEDEADNDTMSTGFRVILFISLFSLITFSVSLFGYPDLASFIFDRFFVSVFLFGTFVVVRTMIFDILRRGIIFLARTYRLRKRLLSKVDLLMSIIVTPFLLVVLAYFMLRLWGMPESLFLYGLKKLFFGFKVGGINISLIAIFTGLLVFVISIYLVRMFKRKLANGILNRINMDEGIKNSLVSGVSFIGFIISAILAVIAMGVDLSNLAVIAGALSVGIGFGLQDVIKNLVSGIIILFERPFKVGDWVILGGEEGKIKQINIRSTELETWTKRSVIIPNATLISSSLVNLTHGNNSQRQSVVVGVSYDSDVDKVTALLMECAKSHRKVLKNPAPMVLFKDFGASSLDFELRYYVADVRIDWGINSDIRYAILKRFREEGIEIAYPQLDVHQK